MARWFGVRDVGLGVLVFYALKHPDFLPFVIVFIALTDFGDLVAIGIPLVRRQGIDRAAWTSVGFALPAAQLCVAWAAAIRLTDDPNLALRIADATPPGAFGIVEYICRSAPTLRDALTQWCRSLRLLDDAVRVGLVDVDAGVALRVLIESEAPAPASHELCFALVVRHARAMVGV
jgi:hypothetical protein